MGRMASLLRSRQADFSCIADDTDATQALTYSELEMGEAVWGPRVVFECLCHPTSCHYSGSIIVVITASPFRGKPSQPIFLFLSHSFLLLFLQRRRMLLRPFLQHALDLVRTREVNEISAKREGETVVLLTKESLKILPGAMMENLWATFFRS